MFAVIIVYPTELFKRNSVLSTNGRFVRFCSLSLYFSISYFHQINIICSIVVFQPKQLASVQPSWSCCSYHPQHVIGQCIARRQSLRPHTIVTYHIVRMKFQNAKEQQGGCGHRVPGIWYHRTQQRYVAHWRPALGTVRPNVSLPTPETTDHRYGNVSKKYFGDRHTYRWHCCR